MAAELRKSAIVWMELNTVAVDIIRSFYFLYRTVIPFSTIKVRKVKIYAEKKKTEISSKDTMQSDKNDMRLVLSAFIKTLISEYLCRNFQSGFNYTILFLHVVLTSRYCYFL